MAKQCNYLIVGGGNASGYAIRGLMKDCGIKGSEITMLCGEPVPPYERPALTKAYLHHPGAKVRARLPGFHACVGGGGDRQTPEWYKEHGVSVLQNQWITEVDPEKKVVKTKGGQDYSFNKLLLAVGTKVFNPAPDMYSGSNVFPIRSEADCSSLVKLMESFGENGAKKLVIIGGGYIGVEVASCALGWVKTGHLSSVTILNMDSCLMQRVFADCPEFPEFLQNNLNVNMDGKTYKCEVMNSVKIEGLKKDDNGVAIGVSLSGGVTVPADVIVLGMGTRPHNDFLDAKYKDGRGFIACKQDFSFASDCYAFGDCASFNLGGNRPDTVLEFVAHARASAKHAAQSAAGDGDHAYDFVPFFYSRMFEYSEEPLIWNMFGMATSKSSPTVYKRDNGLASLHVSPEGIIESACLMMRNPPPTPQQLDQVKMWIGTKITNVGDMLASL